LGKKGREKCRVTPIRDHADMTEGERERGNGLVGTELEGGERSTRMSAPVLLAATGKSKKPSSLQRP